jgi:hypothetical protein
VVRAKALEWKLVWLSIEGRRDECEV